MSIEISSTGLLNLSAEINAEKGIIVSQKTPSGQRELTFQPKTDVIHKEKNCHREHYILFFRRVGVGNKHLSRFVIFNK